MNTQASLPIIVLITVNDNETEAILDAFVGEGKAPVQVPKDGLTYNDLGIHGGCRILHTICEMGAGVIGGSQQRTREAIEHWRPSAVIAVGIAFGMDETKQAIGDVLIATQVQDYELGRENEDGTLTPRGDKPGSTDILRNRFRQVNNKERRSIGNWPRVQFGLILSGPKLVDNLDYRDSLKALFPEAIGGEMEAIGLYVGAAVGKVDWILIKAICDWGHNKNNPEKDARQKTAAKNAAQVLKLALKDDGLYSNSVLRRQVEPTNLEAKPVNGERGNGVKTKSESEATEGQTGRDENTSLAIGSRNSLFDVLADAPRLEEAAKRVLESPKYPRDMAVGGRLVPNPVWYGKKLDGTLDIRLPSDRLRGHMFLAVAEPQGMKPYLYCYKAPLWNAYLFPFFRHEYEKLGDTDPRVAVGEHVERRYHGRVTPTDKFVVSVKRNEEHPHELWLYVFQFYNLILPADFQFADNQRWLDLDRLADRGYREVTVNGDVIRGIREYFSADLDPLQRSPVTFDEARFGDS